MPKVIVTFTDEPDGGVTVNMKFKPDLDLSDPNAQMTSTQAMAFDVMTEVQKRKHQEEEE